jgi:hypothetical protein
MTYQWLAYWPMVIYMELLWIFISIKFHIADPCSLSHGQTIKHTGHGQLQYIRIYLEKCRDENYMNIFKIEKPPIPGLQYSTVQYSSTIWIHTQGKIIAVQNKLQMLCFNLELEQVFHFTQLHLDNQSLQILPGWSTGTCSRPLNFLLSLSPFWICMNTWLTNASITLDSLLEWQQTVAIIGHH